jgi:hypothetical protein
MPLEVPLPAHERLRQSEQALLMPGEHQTIAYQLRKSQTLWDRVRFSHSLWDRKRFSRSLWDRVRFSHTLWDFLIVWNVHFVQCQSLFEKFSFTMRYNEISHTVWDGMRFSHTLWDAMRFSQTINLWWDYLKQWLGSASASTPSLFTGEKCKEVVQALKPAWNRTETRLLNSQSPRWIWTAGLNSLLLQQAVIVDIAI